MGRKNKVNKIESFPVAVGRPERKGPQFDDSVNYHGAIALVPGLRLGTHCLRGSASARMSRAAAGGAGKTAGSQAEPGNQSAYQKTACSAGPQQVIFDLGDGFVKPVTGVE